MKLNSARSISMSFVFLCAAMLIGISGTLSAASAAGSIAINGGAPVAFQQQVTLTVTPPSALAKWVRYRNETNTWSTFDQVVSANTFTKEWMLSVGDGDKKVTAEFRDSSNITLGMFSATIRLDTSIIDTSFNSPKGYINYGNLGKTATTGKAVAIQADGKIVSVGSFDKGNGSSNLQVIRYNADGTLDTAFGGGSGMVYYYGNETGAYAGNAVAIKADGKIVVVGTYDKGNGDTDAWVLQLTSTGSLDSSFAGGGYLVVGGNGADSGNGLAIQPDGKIIVAGTYDNGGANNTSAWLLRITAAGTLDTAFNILGNSKFGVNGAHSANGVALQTDGKILVTGTYDHGNGLTSVWVLRTLDTGILDTSFGRQNGASKTGEKTFGDLGQHKGNAVAVDAAGKIFIIGTYDWTSGNTDAWLLKLDSVGAMDTTFGLNGTVAFGGDGSDSGNALAIQADGKIIVVGTYDNLGTTSLMVNRVKSSGTLDVSFNNGTAAYSFGSGGIFEGHAVALQADNKIIVVGKGDNLAGTSSILTLRLQSITVITKTLTVTTTGAGTVTTADPGALTWGLPDTNGNVIGAGDFASGEQVVLTAVPANAGVAFLGWSGCNSTSGLTCTVTMDAAKNVTASFDPDVTLTVSVVGVGTVAGPSNINCTGSGSGCSAKYPKTTEILLTATPAWYNHIVWSGACTGTTSPCNLIMDSAKSVTATFVDNINVGLTKQTTPPTPATYYAKLSTAYANVTAGSTFTLAVRNMSFPESLIFNKASTVSLNGGKDSNWAKSGFTTLMGSLKVSSGKLIVRNIKVQ